MALTTLFRSRAFRRLHVAFDVAPKHELSDAPPIVLLHGLLGRGRNMKSLARGLSAARSCRVVGLDLPGHGNSPATEDYEYDTVCPLVAAAASEALGDGVSYDLVGHSYGGKVAFRTWLDAPQVRSVSVLDIEPFSNFYTGVGSRIRALLRLLLPLHKRPLARAELKALLRSNGIADAPTLAFLDGALEGGTDGQLTFALDLPALDAGIEAMQASCIEVSNRQRLAKLQAARKVQLVYGSASRFVDPGSVEERLAAAGISGVELVRIHNARHFLHTDNSRHETLLQVIKFFDAVDHAASK